MTSTVKLKNPITRGEEHIEELTLAEPTAKLLKGINLNGILSADVDTLMKLIPRISQPVLTAAEVGELGLVDLTRIANEIGRPFQDAD